MSRRLLWGTMALLLLCALVLLGLSQLRWEKHTMDMGFTDKALRAPYLAARQFLSAQGVHVRKEQGLTVLDQQPESRKFPARNDAMVVLDAYGMLSPARSARLLHWVAGGGQLIMAAENPFIQVDGRTRDPIFQALGVQVREQPLKPKKSDRKTSAPAKNDRTEAGKVPETPWPANKPAEDCKSLGHPIRFHFNGDKHPVDIAVPGQLRLRVPKDADAALLGDKAGIRFAQFNVGKGQVTLLASARLWSNRYIGCYDHAYMLWQLTTDGTLWWLTNEKGPSLWRYLWSVAALLLLAFASWLGALFWRRGTRFGPLQPVEGRQRRRLAEHLDASARYLWRTGHSKSLLEALRWDVIEGGKRHRADFARLSADERWSFLAGITGFESSRIGEAMSASTNDGDAFTHTVNMLQAIRNRL